MVSAATALGIGLLAGCTQVSAQTQYVYADVLESRPIYQSVSVSTPRQQCWHEQVAVREERRTSNTPVVVSSIVGGALGNALGNNKSSQRVGTVVGAVLGHSVGRDIVAANSRSQPMQYQTVQRCETVNEYRHEERLTGYQVRYRYNGEDYTIQTDRDPGSQIRLRVQVSPVL